MASEGISGKSYRLLHQQLQDLIHRGAKVCDPIAGSRATEIHDWVEHAGRCLLPLNERIPTALSDFERFRQDLEFKVKEGEEINASESAYSPDGDFLADFRFENLLQMNGILKVAAKRVVAMINTIEESSGAKAVFFDVRVLKAARNKLDVTQEEAAGWFGVNERTIKRWEAGQPRMRREVHRRFKVFVEWAEKGNKGLPPPVTKMSP